VNVLIDTGVLGFLCHPNPALSEAAEHRFDELRGRASTPPQLCLPEIADYELRRKLLHIGSTRSLAQLDRLAATFVYLPLTTEVMRGAARLWADARSTGRPTGAPTALDGDAILAAQALTVGGLVVTTNRKHLTALGVAVEDWSDLTR
jgi:predicted nucleic acid-binding protein